MSMKFRNTVLIGKDRDGKDLVESRLGQWHLKTARILAKKLGFVGEVEVRQQKICKVDGKSAQTIPIKEFTIIVADSKVTKNS